MRVDSARPDQARLLAALYDWEHDELDDDLPFYNSMARRTGGPVLELGCGSGRVLAALAGQVASVVGVDISQPMLDRARGRLRDAHSVELRRGDMTRDLPSDSFSLVVLALDAFGYVSDRIDQCRLLEGVRQILSPCGLVVIDLVNPGWLCDQPDGVAVLQRSSDAPAVGAYVTKWMTRSLRWDLQELELRSFFDLTWPDGSLTRITDCARLRYFSRYEMELLIERAGLQLEAVYGDYDAGPYEHGSPRMVFVAQPSLPPEALGDICDLTID